LRPPVFVISNDVVPNLTLPVAAPGLRAFGLAEGLRSNGLRVKTLVPRGSVDRRWRRLGRSAPSPTAPGTEFVDERRLSRYLEANAPAVAVITNSNHVDHLRPIEGIRYVVDFFAPKMLETLYQHGAVYPKKELKDLRRRKIQTIELADAFVVNGSKKVPYFLAWILQADRDIRQIPLEVVNMCVPISISEREPRDDGRARFAVAGYLQSWSLPGGWMSAVTRRLDDPRMSLDLLTPWHWGGGAGRSHESESGLVRLAKHPSVTTHASMTFSDFQKFLSNVDVSVDLFEHNLEREYAMVTRSVISLSCGVPVIHPPFTEVSKMISDYDAGWLVDPRDTEAIEQIVESILEQPDLLREKQRNARTLAAAVLDPKVAVEPLVRILESW